ncbi:MAG: hypothetical protein ABI614_15005, partial [Planctomycetota bacterium]
DEYCFLWSSDDDLQFADYEKCCQTSAVRNRAEVIEYLTQCAKEGARTVLYNYDPNEESASLAIGTDILMITLHLNSVPAVLDN